MSELSYLEKLLDGVEVEWKSLGEVAEIYGGLTGKTKADFEKGEDYNFLVTIYSGKKVLSTFRLNRKVVE